MALFRNFGHQIFQKIKAPALTDCFCRPMSSASKHPGYRSQCAGEEPKCSEKSLKEKKDRDECHKEERVSMWLNPECCLDVCKDVLPRFDDLYYKPSDKAKRKYTRTWNECPELRIAPRKICCFENISLPPMEKRKKSSQPKTACAVPVHEEKSCSLVANKRCVKIRLPGCNTVRDPPKCFVIKPPANCRKICTPYPAFSECMRPKPKPRRPAECNCLIVAPLCAVH